jgi:hypothetical protein
MRRSVPAVIVVTVLAAACGRHDRDRDGRNIEAQGNVANRDSALTLGAGDVKIVSEDSSVDLAVVGQQIVVRLSDKTMNKVRGETDTMAVKDSGFGGSIERMVKRTVQSALGHQFQYPLSDVRDAKYENGAIVLEPNGDRQPRLLANTKINGKKLMESFRPDDAKRFVAAVNAKKGH